MVFALSSLPSVSFFFFPLTSSQLNLLTLTKESQQLEVLGPGPEGLITVGYSPV